MDATRKFHGCVQDAGVAITGTQLFLLYADNEDSLVICNGAWQEGGMGTIYPKGDVERVVGQALSLGTAGLRAPADGPVSASNVVALCNATEPDFISEHELGCVLKRFAPNTATQIRNSLRPFAKTVLIAEAEAAGPADAGAATGATKPAAGVLARAARVTPPKGKATGSAPVRSAASHGPGSAPAPTSLPTARNDRATAPPAVTAV